MIELDIDGGERLRVTVGGGQIGRITPSAIVATVLDARRVWVARDPANPRSVKTGKDRGFYVSVEANTLHIIDCGPHGA